MDYETRQAEKQKIAEHEAADALKRPERANRLIRFLDKTNRRQSYWNDRVAPTRRRQKRNPKVSL